MTDDATLLDLFDQQGIDIDDALGSASAVWLRHLCNGDEPLYLPTATSTSIRRTTRPRHLRCAFVLMTGQGCHRIPRIPTS